MSAITHLSFCHKVNVPGTGDYLVDVSRQGHWEITVIDAHTVRLWNKVATSRPPFTVCGVPFSYRTEDDVAAKVKKVAA